MNKNRPTVERVSWTTTALNHFLVLYEDLMSLQITKEERNTEFANGTQQDVGLIYQVISKKMRTDPREVSRKIAFDIAFWYNEEPEFDHNTRPSDRMEEAFDQVGDLYVKHQTMWDDTEEVESASEDEEGSDDSDVEM
jgi:hypothetical protein